MQSTITPEECNIKQEDNSELDYDYDWDDNTDEHDYDYDKKLDDQDDNTDNDDYDQKSIVRLVYQISIFQI